MSTFKKLFVIFALFSVFGQTALAQSSCGNYKTLLVAPFSCYYTSILVGWVSPLIQTRIDFTNTTTATVTFRVDINGQDGYGAHVMMQLFTEDPELG